MNPPWQGSMEARVRHGKLGADFFKCKQKSGEVEPEVLCGLKLPKPTPSGTLPLANLYLLNLPNSTTNREPSVQTPEPRGHIIIQTIKVLFDQDELCEAVRGQLWPLVKWWSINGVM